MLNIKKKVGMALATTAMGAMLIGSGTFAWFHSETSNTDNQFKTGKVLINLDKEVKSDKYFALDNILPGDSGDTTFTVTNKGTTELRYDLTKTLPSQMEIKDSEDNQIKHFHFTITDESGTDVTTKDITNVVLGKDQSDIYTVNWSLDKEAGNDYAGKDSSFGISVSAVQTANNSVS